MRFLIPFMLLAVPAIAESPLPVLHETDMDYEDAVFAVSDAIINAGLVVEGESFIADMLNRTKADVGGSKDIFAGAQVFTFCSAKVSREVMERDPNNIQFCPYSIFVYQKTDAGAPVQLGHPDYAANGLPEVASLLEAIIQDALDL